MAPSRPRSIPRAPLPALVADLARQHGHPPAAFPTRAFELVLWENVAYLANDAKRREAFDTLKRSVGTKPREILDATADESGDDRAAHLAADQLLRSHGQEVCRRSSPHCESRMVAATCSFARASGPR